MRMFRSMRNPVSKVGRTSNITGSRIRTSARTIREKTGNLVQNARKKISMSSPVLGYKHATSPRTVPGSAAAAGEKARKKAYGQGQTTKYGRSATYSAIKSAKAPSDAPLGYKAGYAAGARVAGSTYKQNILTKTGTTRPNPHIQGGSYLVAGKGRTGLESRVQTAAKVAGIQTRRFASNLLKNKPVQPAHIQRPVSNAPLFDMNKARSAISSLKSAAGRVAAGAKAGYRMPDASVRQTYNAQRFSTSASFPNHAPVPLASRTSAGVFASGYGIGKSARKAVSAPGKAYSAGQKVTFGIQDALSGVGRGFKYAAQGNLQTAKYAAMNASHAAYHGTSLADRIAGRIVNPIERGMRKLSPVATALGKLNVRAVEAAVPGFTSDPLMATAKRIAQPVRYAQRKANERSARIAAEAARQQRIQNATPWGPKGSVTPTGKNAVVQQQRYQAASLGGAASNMGVMGPPRPGKAYRNRVTPPAQPQQLTAKTPWGGRTVNWSSYQPQQQPQQPTKPFAQPATKRPRTTRMPSGKTYGGKVQPGQPHGMRNKQAAQKAAPKATQPPAAASVPKAQPMTRQEKLDRIVAMRKQVNAVIDEEHKKPISNLGGIMQANRDYYEKMGRRFKIVQPLSSNLSAYQNLVQRKGIEALQKGITPDKMKKIGLFSAARENIRVFKEQIQGGDPVDIAAVKSRAAELVAKVRERKTPTTGTQSSLLPEEPQRRKRGQRGPDRNPRKSRGQAGK